MSYEMAEGSRCGYQEAPWKIIVVKTIFGILIVSMSWLWYWTTVLQDVTQEYGQRVHGVFLLLLSTAYQSNFF